MRQITTQLLHQRIQDLDREIQDRLEQSARDPPVASRERSLSAVEQLRRLQEDQGRTGTQIHAQGQSPFAHMHDPHHGYLGGHLQLPLNHLVAHVHPPSMVMPPQVPSGHTVSHTQAEAQTQTQIQGRHQSQNVQQPTQHLRTTEPGTSARHGLQVFGPRLGEIPRRENSFQRQSRRRDRRQQESTPSTPLESPSSHLRQPRAPHQPGSAEQGQQLPRPWGSSHAVSQAEIRGQGQVVHRLLTSLRSTRAVQQNPDAAIAKFHHLFEADRRYRALGGRYINDSLEDYIARAIGQSRDPGTIHRSYEAAVRTAHFPPGEMGAAQRLEEVRAFVRLLEERSREATAAKSSQRHIIRLGQGRRQTLRNVRARPQRSSVRARERSPSIEQQRSPSIGVVHASGSASQSQDRGRSAHDALAPQSPEVSPQARTERQQEPSTAPSLPRGVRQSRRQRGYMPLSYQPGPARREGTKQLAQLRNEPPEFWRTRSPDLQEKTMSPHANPRESLDQQMSQGAKQPNEQHEQRAMFSTKRSQAGVSPAHGTTLPERVEALQPKVSPVVEHQPVEPRAHGQAPPPPASRGLCIWPWAPSEPQTTKQPITPKAMTISPDSSAHQQVTQPLSPQAITISSDSSAHQQVTQPYASQEPSPQRPLNVPPPPPPPPRHSPPAQTPLPPPTEHGEPQSQLPARSQQTPLPLPTEHGEPQSQLPAQAGPGSLFQPSRRPRQTLPPPLPPPPQPFVRRQPGRKARVITPAPPLRLRGPPPDFQPLVGGPPRNPRRPTRNRPLNELAEDGAPSVREGTPSDYSEPSLGPPRVTKMSR